MPSLRHLIEELQQLDADPSDVHLPGHLYDDLLDQVQDIVENPEEE